MYSISENNKNRYLLRESSKKNLILLSGAGISKQNPSNIPLSDEIVENLINLFCKIAFNNENAAIRNKIDIKTLRIEIIFDVLKNIFDKDILDCFSEINCQRPNLNHLYIAQFCQSYKIRDIFTLNFDLLHETSFKSFSEYNDKIKYKSYSSDIEFNDYDYSDSNNYFNIYHLHGSFENLKEIYVSTLDIGLSLSQSKKDLLQKKLEGADIFCFGYSDHDPDIFPIIANSKNRIFWYLFNKNDIPDIVSDYQKSNQDKLKFIYRFEDQNQNNDEHEESFYNSLIDIFPILENEELPKKILNSNQNQIKTINERLESYCQYIKEYIQNESNNSIDTAKYVIGCILRNQTNYRDALDIFNSITKEDPKLTFYVSQEIANIYETLGEPKNSESYWNICYKIALKEKEFEKHRDYIFVRLQANLIKSWKRGGSNSEILSPALYNLFNIIKSNDENASTFTLFTIADLLHHTVEYLPSTLKITNLDPHNINESNLSMLNTILNNKLTSDPDTFFNIFFNISGTRTLFLITAAYYYHEVIDKESRNYQYKVLSQLRLYEIYFALKDQIQGDYLSNNFFGEEYKNIEKSIDNILNYYKWADIHDGIGNAYLTKGIIDFYKKEYTSAEKNFRFAISNYRENKSGETKCDTYLNKIHNLS